MVASFSTRRILVAVDDSPECAVSLQSVMRMAERSKAAVEALFVEDTTVLHLASLTVVKHVHRHGGPAAPLDVTTIESMYRSQRLGAQRAIAALTDATGANCDLRVVRGSVSGALLQASSEADLVVLTLPSFGLQRLAGVAETLSGTGVHALLLLRSTVKPRRMVVLADSSTEADERLLSVTSGIAGLLGLPLRVVSERPDEIRDLGTRFDVPADLELVTGPLDQVEARGEFSSSSLVACHFADISSRLAPYGAILDSCRCPLLIAF